MFIYFNKRFAQELFQVTQITLIQHLNNGIFWALSADHFSNLQRSEPKNNKNNNIRICNVLYQAGSRWDPRGVFDFLLFFLKNTL